MVIELGEFGIEYRPRTTIKGQTVADFVVGLTSFESQEEASKPKPWEIHVDRSSNQEARGVGVVIEIPQEEQVEFIIKLESTANNEIEYEALIAELLIAELFGGKYVTIYSNSQLVVGQMNGNS